LEGWRVKGKADEVKLSDTEVPRQGCQLIGF